MDEDSIKIESTYSAISPGTERLVFQGLVPPSLKSKMAVPYMEGDFSFPVKYGYSLVGNIVDGYDELVGQRVHVMHPHQNLAIVNEGDVSILPDDITDQRAALISNTETCVNAIWDSKVAIGDRVLIVGFGTIGSILAMILKRMEFIQIHVVDINPAKLQLAEDLGFTALDPDQIEKDSYDLSYHTSSTGNGLQLAVDAVGKENKIIELSWYGSKSIDLNLGTSFHVNRKSIISSQVSSIPRHKQVNWDYMRRKNFVLDILKTSEFDKLITKTVKFESIGHQFSDLCNPNNNLSLLVDYR